MQENFRQGNGIYFFKNGEVYKGNFALDKMEGGGTYFYNDGIVIEGFFKDNKLMND